MSLPDQPGRRDSIDLFAGAIFLAGLAISAFLWRCGPAGPLPMHLSVLGVVDGWGDRTSVAILLGGTTSLLAICYGLTDGLIRRLEPATPARRGLTAAKRAILCIEVMIAALTMAMAYADFSSPEHWGRRVTTGLLALMFLAVGVLLGKAAPNPFVGIRTYWTMKSRLAWDKSNRLAGRLFFWIGVAGLPTALFVDSALVTAAMISAILLAAVVSVIEGWRVWRTDPERQLP